MAALSTADGDTGDNRMGLLATFHYDGSAVALTGLRPVQGEGPERVVERSEGLRMVVEDSHGATLHTFTVMDPRYKDFAYPLGGAWLTEADFSEVIPFYVEAKRLRVLDVVSGAVLGAFDLSTAVEGLCAQFPDHSPCYCEGDLDDDHDMDGVDLSIFGKAYAKNDPLADVNEDLVLDMEDVKVFAGKFGRPVCPNLDLPDCEDGDLCTHDYYDPRAKECIHQPKECYDGCPCTTDWCDPKTGNCVHTSKDCSDGLPCTVDSCDPVSGECLHTPVDCDDGNACTTDFCNPQTGQCVHKTVICNDGSYCTTDQCDPVVGCFYIQKNCDDKNDCTIDSCDPQTGECVYSYNPKCQACCKGTQCLDLPPIVCTIQGGTPMGPGTNCQNTKCTK
jgi:hypothetical protein